MLAFQKDVAKLQNAVSATAQSLTLASEQVAAAKEAISSSTNASAEIMAATRKIELAIKALEVELSGDPLKEERYEQTVPSIGSRIGGVLFGSMRNTHGITETQRQQVEIAKADFEEISEKIQKLLTDDLEEFKSSLDDAGVPWTAGRAIPDVD
jgi:chromosome segregation ATPase